MTTASELLPPSTETSIDVPVEAPVARRPRTWSRFLGAFLVSACASLVLLGTSLLIYDRSFDHRILPGVRVGGIDLSGLDREGAGAAIASAYGGYGDGQVVIRTSAGDVSIPFGEFSRRPDTEAMIDDAMSAGRTGSLLDRAIAEMRMALRGVPVEPRLALDEAALASGIAHGLARLERDPLDASIGMGEDGIVMTRAQPGRAFDVAAAQAAAIDTARRLDAPAEIVVGATAIPVPPARSDTEILAAKAAAERMIADVVVADGSSKWTIPAATVRRWVGFETVADGSIQPVVAQVAIPAALPAIAKDTLRKPVSASFLTGKGGTVVGVSPSRDGRRLDTTATAAAIAKALADRGTGGAPVPVAAVVITTRPELTTEEASKVAPLMVRLGSWKTWFPIGERNSWGANIWLPALYINGTVLDPGETFEWWRAVGPVTRSRGFGLGGVIKGDHTEPTGALGGGMCSSSTTLFNAALRAGLKMGARYNHRYYINRYPLGLDATVSKMGGSGQTMTFTNDMDHPILIRGFKVRGSGGKGWVRYEIWGIPDGRKVSISKPVVTNVRKATTKTFEVSTLPAGVRKQTEYPVNGMDVSVTRVVRDRAGHVIHQETYRTHYQLWNGRIEVGV